MFHRQNILTQKTTTYKPKVSYTKDVYSIVPHVFNKHFGLKSYLPYKSIICTSKLH